jgi:hypothetical protein
MEIKFHALNSAVDVNKRSSSRSDRFMFGMPWTGDWLGPRVGLAEVTERKIPVTSGNRTSVVQRGIALLFCHSLYWKNDFVCFW